MSFALPDTPLAAGLSTMLGALANKFLKTCLEQTHCGTHAQHGEKWLWVSNCNKVKEVIGIRIIVDAVERLVTVHRARHHVEMDPGVIALLIGLRRQVKIGAAFTPTQVQWRLRTAWNK
jgi:hypothetical protein